MMIRKNIGELLLEYQLLNESDLKSALEIQKKDGGRIGEILVRTGKVTEDDIQYLLSKQLNIPYVILEGINPDNSLLKRFNADFLLENRILPIYETAEKLFIATDDPFNKPAFDVLENITGKTVDISAASSSKIKRILSGMDKISVDFGTFLDEILKKVSESPLYRMDFLYENETLKVSGFGFNFLKELGNAKYETFDYKDILSFFGKKCLGLFYEIFENPRGFFMKSYPVTVLSGGCLIKKFGHVNAGGVAFTDMDYAGSLQIFKSGRPVDGYLFLSFGHFIDKQNVVNIYDNLPVDKRGAKITDICGNCNGKGCELCNNLGVIFFGEENA